MDIRKTRRGESMLEGVRITFKNFAGRKTQFNPPGKRNFSVVLTPEMADAMAADGWSIKTRPAREEGDPDLLHMKVNVNYDSEWPPQVILITENGQTTLDEETVGMIDGADIANVDLVINPSPYTLADGTSGVSAYLNRAYITINEDEFERKYSRVDGPAF